MDTGQKSDDKASIDSKPVTLHPDGDAILVIPGSDPNSNGRFLVSSTVLCIASPVFKVLLTSLHFQEGLDVQKGLCPEILLAEDDQEAMQILLSILHFKNPEDYFQLDAEVIAKIAVHCDKYDCIEAMKPWASIWLDGDGFDGDVGLFLSAAFNFRSSSALRKLSFIAIRDVDLETAAKWAKKEMIYSIPDELLGMEAKTLFDQDLIVCRRVEHSKGGAS